MANIVQHLTPAERAAQGREARKSVPRTWHGDWDVAQRRLEPLDLLAEQATSRLPELVPVRHGRMAASPFAYYRGAALPMAADLATLPNTGLRVQLCGDAHLCNFGGFASPERDLVFDVNDFDETAPGPFEWDLKRLCASLEIAARSRGFDPKTSRDMSLAGARAYQRAIREFAGMPALDVWYTHLDVEGVIARWGATVTPKRVQAFRRLAQNATAKNEIKARAKLTKPGPDGLRFRSDPPLLVPIRDLWDEAESEATIVWVHELIRSYRRTLEDNRRHLLETYRFADLARKVVGVGSVGTRSWVALFVGRDENDTLILQVKEAEASVLERFAGRSPYRNHGQRVVAGQRLMQAASDIFLGWHRVAKGIDGAQHDYYVRQLWDWKVSADVDTMPPDVMAVYAQMCGWTLARAHARSGDPLAISSYIGSSDTLPLAVAQFASAYADQNDTDYQALHNAINDGTVQADTTV